MYLNGISKSCVLIHSIILYMYGKSFNFLKIKTTRIVDMLKVRATGRRTHAVKNIDVIRPKDVKGLYAVLYSAGLSDSG